MRVVLAGIVSRMVHKRLEFAELVVLFDAITMCTTGTPPKLEFIVLRRAFFEEHKNEARPNAPTSVHSMVSSPGQICVRKPVGLCSCGSHAYTSRAHLSRRLGLWTSLASRKAQIDLVKFGVYSSHSTYSFLQWFSIGQFGAGPPFCGTRPSLLLCVCGSCTLFRDVGAG